MSYSYLVTDSKDYNLPQPQLTEKFTSFTVLALTNLLCKAKTSGEDRQDTETKKEKPTSLLRHTSFSFDFNAMV